MNRLKIAFFLVIIVHLVSGCARQQVPGDSPTDTVHSLTVDGLERTYILHVPPNYDKETPVPLVLALHGGGGSAEKMANLTGFNDVSDKEGFIVVYPEGIENHWNDGRVLQNYRAHKDNIDDVTFMSVLIDHIKQEYTIDESRIYATGISNGAMMSCRLACELSDKIAAIAMVAGAMPEDLCVHCNPLNPVSVLVINGTEDPLVLWEGGEIKFGRQTLGRTLSVRDTVQFWVTHNNCEQPVITWLPDSTDDGTTVRREVYGNGLEGTEVTLYAIEGGGHTWPGGPQYASERIISRTCYDINGTEVIWQFFTGHTKNQSKLPLTTLRSSLACAGFLFIC